MSATRGQKFKTSSNGDLILYATVDVQTYKFIDEYRGLFSLGVGVDNLVLEVKRLRAQLQSYEDAISKAKSAASGV